MEYRCPACGAASTDPDDCSECGAPISAAAQSVAQSPAAVVAAATPAVSASSSGSGTASETVCPECNEARASSHTRYCDNCRYDFLLRQPYAAAPAAPEPAPAVVASAPVVTAPASQAPASTPQAPPTAASLMEYELLVQVDLSLRPADLSQSQVPDPTDCRERQCPLLFERTLIGRGNPKKNIHPEIVIADPVVSGAHAAITREADGSLTLLDLNSSNGTRLNGADVTPNVPTPIKDGDEITMGCWTRAVLRGH